MRRKVDMLLFEKDGFTLKVPIYMVRHGEDDPTKYEAEVVNQEPPLSVHVNGDSIDEVRQQLRAGLEQQLALKWEPYLFVQVNGWQGHPSAISGKTKNSLEIEYTHIQVAVFIH